MKRGAIQLSTTAIVSIILAFVFLGLVITFTRSIFTQGQGQLDKFWSTLNLNQKASPDNPVLFPQSVSVKKGKTADFGVRIYNTLANPLNNAKPKIDVCVDEAGNDVFDKISFITTPATIPSGGEQGFQGKIKASSDLSPGDYVCSIVITSDSKTVNDLPQGQLIVTVTV
ncbi:MAG: hypothetical protein PWP03_187 [Candidatus Woesearchaeota archaeon]|nr:hypothetical protein [Candidatus Woesearchaeota archaeon]MDN5327549.1 hypothetical protein [Candidatus Woesearchaeota archaeon]